MKRGSHHNRVGSLRPKRTAFDLSYEHKFTCDTGLLIPVQVDEVVPGDHWTISTACVVRMQPTVVPFFHEINISTHTFFVPYRLLDKDWEQFITGGAKGDYVGVLPTHPIMTVPNSQGGDYDYATLGSLWDFFGFPMGVPLSTPKSTAHFLPSSSSTMPMQYPWRAYGFIWNEFYRDENLQPRIGESEISNAEYDITLCDQLTMPLYRNYVKDYFTSALNIQQRGPAVAFPISGEAGIIANPLVPSPEVDQQGHSALPIGVAFGDSPYTGGGYPAYFLSGRNAQNNSVAIAVTDPNTQSFNNMQVASLTASIVNPQNQSYMSLNLKDLATFDMQTLRYLTQLTKWMERNARGGIRYTEFLQSHFGVFPPDYRLQRPEYIGGTKQSLQVSEVLQTGANYGDTPPQDSPTSPLGTMGGHGIMASRTRAGKYNVVEYGLIMTLMSIMPTPCYEDGFNRQWLRKINVDFYFPEFQNLSEQGIMNMELFADGSNLDTAIWGYQPQYDEMRIKRNMVSSEMRVNTPSEADSLSYWHWGRAFSALPPLSSAFVSAADTSDPNLGATIQDRMLAVRGVKPWICTVGNIIKAVRPLPYIGEPGLLDHH